MAAVDVATVRAWTAVRVRANRAEPVVDWALLDRPFREPFFEQDAERAMRRPFNQVFARRTPLAILDAFAAEPGSEPDGLIFHMSRCGSTVVAQMLAALPAARVVSEAQPLDALLTLHGQGRAEEETTIRRLRALTSALAGASAGDGPLFVKWNAWHVLELPLILRAFPSVPWIFVFREPRAVLESHARSPGAEAFAGASLPAHLEIHPSGVASMSQDEYAARAVAAFCDAAIRHGGMGRPRFVDYAALPDVVVTDLAAHFGVSACEDGAERMRAAAVRDTKRAGVPFTPRGDEPWAPQVERLASEWLDPVYRALLARTRLG